MKRIMFPNGLKRICTTITNEDAAFCEQHNLIISELLREKINERRVLGGDFTLASMKKRMDKHASWIKNICWSLASTMRDDDYNNLIKQVEEKTKKDLEQ